MGELDHHRKDKSLTAHVELFCPLIIIKVASNLAITTFSTIRPFDQKPSIFLHWKPRLVTYPLSSSTYPELRSRSTTIFLSVATSPLLSFPSLLNTYFPETFLSPLKLHQASILHRLGYHSPFPPYFFPTSSICPNNDHPAWVASATPGPQRTLPGSPGVYFRRPRSITARSFSAPQRRLRHHHATIRA